VWLRNPSVQRKAARNDPLPKSKAKAERGEQAEDPLQDHRRFLPACLESSKSNRDFRECPVVAGTKVAESKRTPGLCEQPRLKSPNDRPRGAGHLSLGRDLPWRRLYLALIGIDVPNGRAAGRRGLDANLVNHLSNALDAGSNFCGAGALFFGIHEPG
jgi:hypothetical protein